MNIEESVKEIEKIKEIFIHLRNYGWINDIKKDINTDNAIQSIETLLTAYEKEKEKNKELESDIEQKNFEIKCLNSDIKNMYCEEGVIAILEDNFGLSRDEAISILEEE